MGRTQAHSAADLDELRTSADDFLRTIIRQCHSSGQDAARHITALALENDNPVRSFFAAAVAKVAQTSATPASNATERLNAPSRALSWLARTRGDSSAWSGNPASLVSRTAQQRSSNSHRRGETPSARTPMSRDQSHSTPKLTKSSSSAATAPYNCVLCACDLSSKGVCKRHLMDQHVMMKIYECEKCRQPFKSKAQAKQHSGDCGAGVFYYVAVQPETKKMYACELTGQCFQSLKTYIEHLIKLCENPRTEQLQRSVHRKLRALLSQPKLLHSLRDASNSIYGSPDGWKSVRWSEDVLHDSIRELEFATVSEGAVLEFSGPSGRQDRQRINTYLVKLLCAGELSTSRHASSSSQAPDAVIQGNTTARQASTPVPMQTSPEPQQSYSADRSSVNTTHATPDFILSPTVTAHATPVPREHGAKRPLSGYDSTCQANHPPPGPAISTTQSLGGHNPSPHVTYPYDQNTSMVGFDATQFAHNQQLCQSDPMQLSMSSQSSSAMAVDIFDHVISANSSAMTLAPPYLEPQLMAVPPLEASWPSTTSSGPMHYTLPQDQVYLYQTNGYFPQDGNSLRRMSVSTVDTYPDKPEVHYKLDPGEMIPPRLDFGQHNTAFPHAH